MIASASAATSSRAPYPPDPDRAARRSSRSTADVEVRKSRTGTIGTRDHAMATGDGFGDGPAARTGLGAVARVGPAAAAGDGPCGGPAAPTGVADADATASTATRTAR